MGDGAARAAYYRDEVTTAMAELRAPIDKLEIIVDRKYGRCHLTAISS